MKSKRKSSQKFGMQGQIPRKQKEVRSSQNREDFQVPSDSVFKNNNNNKNK